MSSILNQNRPQGARTAEQGQSSAVVDRAIEAQRLFNTSIQADREQALQLCMNSHGHVMRLIGSCPGEGVVKQFRTAVMKAFSTVPVGPIFIGGTESHASNDPGKKVSTIPGLATGLQALTYNSQRHRLVAPVFGTLPIDHRSDIEGQGIIRRGAMCVRVPRELQRALVFPGEASYLWNTEAQGMVRFARQLLEQRPDSHYSALFVGGGGATELEYELTLELAKEFPGRVSLRGVEHSGGTTDHLLRRRHLEGVRSYDSDIVQALQRDRIEAHGLRGDTGIETHDGTVLTDAIRAIVSAHGLGAHNRQEELLAEILQSQGVRPDVSAKVVGQLVDLLDYKRAQWGVADQTERNLRERILSWRLKQHTKSLTPAEKHDAPASTNQEFAKRLCAGRITHFLKRVGDEIHHHQNEQVGMTDIAQSLDPLRNVKPGAIVKTEYEYSLNSTSKSLSLTMT